jgi:hypothetical protein
MRCTRKGRLATVIVAAKESNRMTKRSGNLAEFTNAFTAPGPQKFGNSGRNILRGSGTKQVDLSLFKEFYISEDRARRLQFRSEFFNVSNTPQFNNPANTVGSPGAASIRSAGAPLTFQRTSRQIQFALKLYF